jgi:Domain of unknown function (DUF2017)
VTGYGPDGFPADEGSYRTASFRAIPGGAACYFEPGQAGIIRSLVAQVAELVGGDASGPGEQGDPGSQDDAGTVEDLEAQLGLTGETEPPDDPVLARLFPDGYKDDPEASAEFRRYTQESLRSAKIACAQAVLESLPPGGGDIRLSEPECQLWLRALNDVRLALSVRLGITDEDEDPTEDLALDDPRSVYMLAYQWLAYLQDSLIEALS